MRSRGGSRMARVPSFHTLLRVSSSLPSGRSSRRELSLGRELVQWQKLPVGGAEVVDTLTDIVERRNRFRRGPARGWERSLSTVEASDDDTNVEVDSRDPVEVLYLDFGDLHEVQPIDPFR